MGRKKRKREPIFRKLTECKPKTPFFVENVKLDFSMQKSAATFGLSHDKKIEVIEFDPKNGDILVKNENGEFWIERNLAEKIILRDL